MQLEKNANKWVIREIYKNIATENLKANVNTWINYSHVTVGDYSCQHYHFHMPIVMKSGSLKLLEPSGAVQGLL
jgi:hypothetical protein